MSSKSQQIVLGGVGGQGILFITKILAQVAIGRGLPVLVSETHGMAQRGGTVVSHLKVGDFVSPLIRPGAADVLLCVHEESALAHKHLLKKDGICVVNSNQRGEFNVDATGLATEIGMALAANLVLLGFALSKECLFCTLEEVEEYIRAMDTGREDNNLKALKKGAFAKAMR